MINGFWSNDGMNDDKGTRQDAIKDLEENFQSAVQSILSGKKHESEPEIDKSNPFFSAMDTSTDRLQKPLVDAETVEAVVEQQKDFGKHTDQ